VTENVVDSPRERGNNTAHAPKRAPLRRLFRGARTSADRAATVSVKQSVVREREFHYRWEFELRASPQALWPFVADTNRFNRDAGVPFVEQLGPSDERGHRRLRLSKLGIGVVWDEEPFEWIRPLRFGVVRRYRSGPVAEMRVTAELTEREGGGTRLVYKVWARARGPLGRAVIPLQIGRISARRFAAVFRRYDKLALAAARREGLTPSRSKLDASAAALLSTLKRKLIDEGSPSTLVSLLAETIEEGDELTLARMRPYALADAWGVARRDVLQLCLRATRAGLLDLRWELLCPLCRGPQQSASALRDVRSDQHCDSCRIDFTVAFDRSVEVVFRPNAAVRSVAARAFCVGGPQVTPHVVVQQPLAPGERRTISPELEEGRHRLRTQTLAGGRFILVTSDVRDSLTLRAENGAWPEDEPRVGTRPTLTFENATDEAQVFILERTAWGDQAATAAEVTALQLFRDLFATEALRPGDRINVGQMAVLFTDLRNSTRLYREIGDAVAFGAVMNHFDVLREAITREGGAIVKTLGDAIMAVFPRPAPALRAIMRAQAALASPPEGVRPFILKAGLHAGPCIAVTLDGRLDYFGSNVNIAARLEPLSAGTDCVITSDVRNDPEVVALLEDAASGLTAETHEAQLKGFDNESFELWRVKQKRER
jgi:class 3 adenylate cyclase